VQRNLFGRGKDLFERGIGSQGCEEAAHMIGGL
jgi:hypothetical protein